MSQTKIKRLGRIRSLEEKQLNTTIIELKRINQDIAEKEAVAGTIQKRLQCEVDTGRALVSVAQMQQRVSWTNAAAIELAAIEADIEALTEAQRKCLEVVAEQRARLKGWSLLIDKMKTEQLDSEARATFLEADERVLRNISSPLGK